MNVRIRPGLMAASAAAAVFTVAACGGGTTGATTGVGTSGPAPTSGPAGASVSSTAGATVGSTAGLTAGATVGSTGGSSVSAAHNDADVMFAQMMIVHHRGAIEMAALAPDRAQSQQVKDLAARIEAAQAPEIDQMNGWLTGWGAAPAPDGTTPGDPASASGATGAMDHGDVDHGDMGHAMPGMMTAEQMRDLENASGAAFDRMFLELMIAHHQGAIDMADTELADGSNPEALALATRIRADQTAEINEMQTLLQTG